MVDVGANWGLHTLYLSKLVGHTGLVVAIEPYPPALAELEWHLRANSCSNVKTYPIALSNIDGNGPFVCANSPSQGHLINHSLTTAPQGDSLCVVTRTLDSITKELDITHLKLVKLDVEGAENEALLGAQQILKYLKPYLIIDLHVDHKQRQRMIDMLIGFGYKVVSAPNWWGILAIPPSAYTRFENPPQTC